MVIYNLIYGRKMLITKMWWVFLCYGLSFLDLLNLFKFISSGIVIATR